MKNWKDQITQIMIRVHVLVFSSANSVGSASHWLNSLISASTIEFRLISRGITYSDSLISLPGASSALPVLTPSSFLRQLTESKLEWIAPIPPFVTVCSTEIEIVCVRILIIMSPVKIVYHIQIRFRLLSRRESRPYVEIIMCPVLNSGIKY